MKKKTFRASLTVEASFVMPVIVICMVAVIWLALYLYNSVRASADADGMIFGLEREIAASPGVPKEMEKDYSEELTGYLLAAVEKAQLKRDGNSVRVNISIRMTSPSRGLMGAFLSHIGQIQLEREAKLPSRSETERIIRAAKDTVQLIKNQIGGEK